MKKIILSIGGGILILVGIWGLLNYWGKMNDFKVAKIGETFYQIDQKEDRDFNNVFSVGEEKSLKDYLTTEGITEIQEVQTIYKTFPFSGTYFEPVGEKSLFNQDTIILPMIESKVALLHQRDFTGDLSGHIFFFDKDEKLIRIFEIY
jgi:hypothetical protein